MDNYIRVLTLFVSCLLLAAGCGDDIDYDDGGGSSVGEEIRITNVGVADVTSTTAVVDARISGPASEMGVCYAVGADPTVESSKIKATDKDFACLLESLEADTEYKVRVFAVGEEGVLYSETHTFRTVPLGVPAITAIQIAGLYPVGGVFKAVVSLEGEPATITERGFCISTDGEPTVDGRKEVAEGTDTGLMSLPIDNLETETVYKVRGYVVYGEGTVVYSGVLEFETPAVIRLHRVYDASSHRVFAQTELHFDHWKDGGKWTDIGLCWAKTESPTVEDGKRSYSDPAKAIYDKMLAMPLNPETQYYIRAYVTDGTDVYYSNEEEFVTGKPLYGNNATFTNEMLPYDEDKGWIFNGFYYSKITPDDELISYGAGRTVWQKDLYSGFELATGRAGGRRLNTLGFSLIKDSNGGNVFALRVNYYGATSGNYVANFSFHVEVDENCFFTVTDFTYENTNNNPKTLYNNFNTNGDLGNIMFFVDYLRAAPFFIDYIVTDIEGESGVFGYMLMSTQSESDIEYFSLEGLRASVTGTAIPQPW